MSVFDEDEPSDFEARNLLTALYLFNNTMSYIPRPEMKRAISNFADKTIHLFKGTRGSKSFFLFNI